MGKSRHKQQQRHGNNHSPKPSSKPSSKQNKKLDSENTTLRTSKNDDSFLNWVLHHKIDLSLCLIFGFLLGAGFGVGLFTGDLLNPPKQWQIVIGKRIRSSSVFHALSSTQHLFYGVNLFHDTLFGKYPAEPDILSAKHSYIEINGRVVRDDPSHPLAFAILRESIIRVDGGFVHPDLGLLIPAPSGAARGLGFIRDSYNACQIRCMPGIAVEKIMRNENGPPFWDAPKNVTNTLMGLKLVLEAQHNSKQLYRPEEVLIRIPISIQMTRTLALRTLLPLVPGEAPPLQELDDAALLVLLLAHEKGSGIESVFLPYINTLPLNPSCGYAPNLRMNALEAISIMAVERNMDVNGWPGEINKAAEHAGLIAEGLAKDYGPYISTPNGETPFENLQWALCQVASRAVAGSEKHGGLRMVPVVDMINHDVNAGEFEELKGNERFEKGDVIDAREDDSGTFIVRSIRHDRRKALKKGQELLANYNVPNYSPLDWFVSLGFVPPERSGKWVLIDAALPKVREHDTTASQNIYRTPKP